MALPHSIKTSHVETGLSSKAKTVLEMCKDGSITSKEYTKTIAHLHHAGFVLITSAVEDEVTFHITQAGEFALGLHMDKFTGPT